MSDWIIPLTVDFVRRRLEGAEAGHDWFHVERVWKLSVTIAQTLACDRLVVELGALLHDIADPKFHNGDETLALRTARDFLVSHAVEERLIEKVLFIIRYVSFKNRSEMPETIPIELKIVQDADRLDAMGAIGVARTFNFGGYKGNPMHDPTQPPRLGMSKAEYKQSQGTTINHFYEKLLLLKDLIHTEKGKALAKERHAFMLYFLDQFYHEWEGRC